MIVLGLDCACSACSVALLADDEIIAHESEQMRRGHAERLVPMIEAVLDQAGRPYADIDRIGVTVGPGSFTGLRTGLATARALALALDIPVVGVTTLAAVAAKAGAQSTPLLVVLETRRADLYVQLFNRPDGLMESPMACLPEEISGQLTPDGVALAGDGAARLLESFTRPPSNLKHLKDVQSPDAAEVAKLAALSPAASLAARETVKPVYIHPPQATIPKNGGKLRP